MLSGFLSPDRAARRPYSSRRRRVDSTSTRTSGSRPTRGASWFARTGTAPPVVSGVQCGHAGGLDEGGGGPRDGRGRHAAHRVRRRRRRADSGGVAYGPIRPTELSLAAARDGDAHTRGSGPTLGHHQCRWTRHVRQRGRATTRDRLGSVLRHEECPPINRVGRLEPGGQRESAVFERVRTCGFHDHLDPTGVTGRIEVRIE